MSEQNRPGLQEHIEPLVNVELIDVYQHYQQLLQQQSDAGESEEDTQVRAGQYLQAALEHTPHTDTQQLLAWAIVFSSSDEEFGAALGVDTID